MRPEEPDVIRAVWDVFSRGGTVEEARLSLAGRTAYIAAKPRLRPEERAEVEDALRVQNVRTVQERFAVSRSRLYEIRRRLKLG